MTIKLIRKMILVVSTIFIGVVVCLSVWLVLREYREDRPSAHERSTFFDNKPTNEHVPQQTQNSDKQPLTASEKAAQSITDTFKSNYRQAGIPNPNMEKLIEIMETPAFATYLEKRNNTQREWHDFLESQGYPVNRNMFSELFRDTFPTGTPADYEPEMRVKIAQMFLTTEPLDPQDPQQLLLQRTRVISQLMSPETEESGRAWFVGQFEEDWDGAIMDAEGDIVNNPAFVWITDVQRNAASIVAATNTAENETTETPKSTTPWDLSSVIESPSVSSDATTGESQSIFPPAPDGLARPAISKPETDAAATPAPGLTDVPNLPTVEGLEASLKGQFSSERFERALNTLERYGPEEGLRRLRENDPEVAKQVERHRSGERKEDSQ